MRHRTTIMPTVTCTPGGAADNSYATEAQATAYFAADMRAIKWTEFSTNMKQVALLQATRDLEGLGGAKDGATAQRAKFAGEPATSTQALHFPRDGDADADGADIIPELVKVAVLEQAYWLADLETNGQLVDFGGLREEGVASFSIDGISASLAANSRPAHIAPRAWEAMASTGLLRTMSGPTRVR